MADGYHHGNLRQALIDAGIRIINENGEDNLSLRKVAAECDVSHAAPYAHFKDKEELLEAMKKSVTDRFTDELERAVREGRDTEESIILMGKAYISFFSRNPDYFTFLFGKQNISAHLQMDKMHEEDYPPFLLLRRLYRTYLKENGIKQTEEEQEIGIIKTWALVHGMASIACMKGVQTSMDWNDPDMRLLIPETRFISD
ncbi:MAG: TetR/AcrR family transcriptional regulator [Lachnospiraceae bacterium]|nr:TetR/AcrR family transcriptional regulator [Lachnospiraceae bacterium]